MAYEIPRLHRPRSWHGRALAAALVFGFFLFLWADGALGPIRFGRNILWTVPLFLLAFFAYEAIGHAVDGAIAMLRRGGEEGR